jgi:enterochelin esterase-like enzyme
LPLGGRLLAGAPDAAALLIAPEPAVTGVTRRGFVLGGLGAAIGAIGGTGIAATQPRGRRVLHAAGLLLGDDHPPPALPQARRPVVTYGRFESRWMRKQVHYAVARPPGVEGPVPVVFCLHGRGADDSFAVEVVRFQDFLAAAGVPVAVAAPDGGPANYWHPRRSGENPYGMLIEEFVPLIDREVGDGRRGLLGWSMGGYGALLAAERNADLFAAVALTSPALWRRFAETAPGAFDDARDFRAHDVFTATDRLAGLPLRADIGRDDPFVPGFEDLRGFLPDASFGVSPGFHDAAFWRSVAPQQVSFLAEHLLA